MENKEDKLLQVGDLVYYSYRNGELTKCEIIRTTKTQAIAQTKSHRSEIKLRRDYSSGWIKEVGGNDGSYKIATPELDARYERECLEKFVMSMAYSKQVKSMRLETLKAIQQAYNQHEIQSSGNNG